MDKPNNRILVLIQNIKSSSLMLPIKSYKPAKFSQFFKNVGNTRKISRDLSENQTIRFSISESSIVEVSSSYTRKCGILHIFVFPQARSQMCVYLFVCCLFFSFICCCFFRGDRIKPLILEDRQMAHLIRNRKF